MRTDTEPSGKNFDRRTLSMKFDIAQRKRGIRARKSHASMRFFLKTKDAAVHYTVYKKWINP